jgi:hypothetical protein
MDNLKSYLNDHLAGSVSALELLEHWAHVHKDKVLGSFFRDIETEIRADQKTLQGAMHRLNIEESNVRQAGAWAAEKIGRARLSMAGNQPGSLGLVLMLEGLIMGVTGKKLMWLALAASNFPQLSGYNFKELERRAEQQIKRIETERTHAVQQAFAERASVQ